MTAPAASLQFLCPRCEETFLFPASEMPQTAALLSCSYCRLEFGGGGMAPRPQSPVERCWVCGSTDFYVQKDFNRELGLMIVIASAMVIFLVMLLISPGLGIACLLLIAALDFIVYRALSTCTVCYLCHSIYRGFPPNPAHQAFYLGSEEKYKRLRQEWIRKTLGPAGPAA
jgi:hypothetical protein